MATGMERATSRSNQSLSRCVRLPVDKSITVCRDRLKERVNVSQFSTDTRLLHRPAAALSLSHSLCTVCLRVKVSREALSAIAVLCTCSLCATARSLMRYVWLCCLSYVVLSVLQRSLSLCVSNASLCAMHDLCVAGCVHP